MNSWVYHPDHEPELVTDEEALEMYQTGWFDTPADFPKEGDTDHGEENSSYRDFTIFTKLELEKYALDAFSVDLDRRKSKANLIKDIEALHDSDQSYY